MDKASAQADLRRAYADGGGNFDRLGHWIATPRFCHWHHRLEREACDVNFAIRFPWPENCGSPEDGPRAHWGQFLDPWTRTGKQLDEPAE